jgi:hypothetical protein
LSNTTSVSFFTFATFGEKSNYRDYSAKYKAISENLRKFDIDVNLIRLEDLEKSLSPSQKKILRLRKGAGYWTWKPNVLEYALKNGTTDIVVYVDCDLVFHSDPTGTVLSAIARADIAAYRQEVSLAANTSKVCLKHFGILENSRDHMWTASMIAARRNSFNVAEFVRYWKLLCGNPALLIDPIFDFSRKHRHDQSIFSCLINSSHITVSDLGIGFMSNGIENRASKLEDLLVSHGQLSRSNHNGASPLKEWIAFFYSKILFAKWCVISIKEKKN